MRSKLNPDGGRIRFLRVQRGWTQEQLAEIAGVSSRTVQRAETGNSASFDTIRAIAGAFVTDFDQLLKPEARGESDPEPHIENPAHIKSSESEIESIPNDLSKPPVRRVWAGPWLSICTLVLGLVTGAILTTHVNMGERASSSESPIIAVVARPSGPLQESVALVNRAQQEKPGIKASSQLTKAPKHLIAESLLESGRAEQPSEIGIPLPVDPGLHDIIRSSQASAPLDLPLHSHTLLSELALPEAPEASSELHAISGSRTLNEPELGAVRQALDLATKKTGTFVSKVSVSIKRGF